MATMTQRFLTDAQEKDLRLLLAAALLDVQTKPKTPRNPEPSSARAQVTEMRQRTA